MTTKKKTNIKRSKVLDAKPVEETVEAVIEDVAEKKPEPAVVEVEPVESPVEVVDPDSKTKLYVAHSNLSNNGERIAVPGQEIALSKDLAAHYNKANPGCIVEVV